MGIKKVMSIKNSKIVIILFIIISFISPTILTNSIRNFSLKNRESVEKLQPRMSDGEKLVDKVFNFTTDRDYVTFSNNIYFIKPYIYYISFQIVTPHECDMNISLWDPEGDIYDIYDSRPNTTLLTQFEYQEIPFGVALTGNYTIKFQAHLTENLNIHIKIINSDLQCLQDVIEPSAFNNKIFYQANKFKNGGNNPLHNVTLKTDTLYRFYFGRYSPIADLAQSETRIYFNITSSIDIQYKIYINKTLLGVCQIEFFDFGTAVDGVYIINMTIYCMVSCVNIAYAIVEESKIADGTDPNDPDPPPDDPVNNTKSGIEVSIPVEFTVGTLAFIGCIVSIPIIIVVYQKRKNLSGLSN